MLTGKVASCTLAGGNIQMIQSGDLVHWTSLGRDAMAQLPPWALPHGTWGPSVLPVTGGYVLYYSAWVGFTERLAELWARQEVRHTGVAGHAGAAGSVCARPGKPRLLTRIKVPGRQPRAPIGRESRQETQDESGNQRRFHGSGAGWSTGLHFMPEHGTRLMFKCKQFQQRRVRTCNRDDRLAIARRSGLAAPV